MNRLVRIEYVAERLVLLSSIKSLFKNLRPKQRVLRKIVFVIDVCLKSTVAELSRLKWFSDLDTRTLCMFVETIWFKEKSIPVLVL